MPPVRQNRERIAAVRRFNRFYTRQIGVLRKNYLDSPYSLGEMRVLYELSHGEVKTATDIGRALDLDAGYLSRVLRNFEKRGLISRKTSSKDARQSELALTARGAKIFAPLEQRSQNLVGGMLGKLQADEQARLVAAMTTIETLLGEPPGRARQSRLISCAQPRHGDFGWIVSRHAELYAQEYGWVEPFEGLCAQIVADFVNNYDAKRERCWIAETQRRKRRLHHAGEGFNREWPASACCWSIPRRAGSVSARAWSTNACALRARPATRKSRCGPTASSSAARHIYEKAGFTLTSSEKKRSWSKDVVAEYWDLEL